MAPSYDTAGDLTNDGIFAYTYDAESRLLSATGKGHKLAFDWDAEGRLATTTLDGTSTSYDYNGTTPMGDWTGTAFATGQTQSRRHVFGAGGDPLYLTVNGVATYSHPDILGSTIALSNATASPVGALSAAFNYDPFGQPVVPLTSTFGYAGQRLEQTTGLIYDGARFYSPAWGRFYSPDPIGYAGGNNLYAYVGNDPLNNTDPFGLAAQQVGSSQWNLTTAYSQSDLDQLNTRLTSARLKGDQNLINQILAEIDNFGDAALATTTVVNSAASGTGPYTVGPYNVIKGTFPGYDAHHVGQKALMLQLIAGYNPDTAPSILVPKVGHTIRGPNGIVSRSTEGLATPRDVLARDISELRRVYPDIPNEKLQELIQLNKGAYPEAFKK